MSTAANKLGDSPVHPGGRPPYEPTNMSRARVYVLAKKGLPQRFIASRLRIDMTTLRKHYRIELDMGMAKRYELPCIKLWEAVAAGEPWAINKVLGEIPEFRPTFRLEHTGADGGPVVTQNIPATPDEAARVYMDMLTAPEKAPAIKDGGTTH